MIFTKVGQSSTPFNTKMVERVSVPQKLIFRIYLCKFRFFEKKWKGSSVKEMFSIQFSIKKVPFTFFLIGCTERLLLIVEDDPLAHVGLHTK